MNFVLTGLAVLIVLLLCVIVGGIAVLVERTKVLMDIDARLQVCETYLADLVEEFASDFPPMMGTLGDGKVVPLESLDIPKADLEKLQQFFKDAIEKTQWNPNEESSDEDDDEDKNDKPWLK